MKKIKITTCIFFSIACFSAQGQIITTTTTTGNIPPRTVVTQPVVAQNISKVTAVTIVLDSMTHQPNGTSYHYHYKGVFNSIGTAPVTYQWVTTNITHPAPSPKIEIGTFTPGGTGIDEVLYETGHGPGNAYKLVLMVTSPNQLTSNPTGF